MFHYIVILTLALSIAGSTQIRPIHQTANSPRSSRRGSYLIIKDNEDDSDYIKNEFVEAAKLARASNLRLDIALVAAKIAEETPRVALPAKSAAIAAAINSARLAIRTNAKFAHAVKAKNLAQMSGEDVDDDGMIKKAIDIVISESVVNKELTTTIDSANQLTLDGEHVDECSNALRKAVSATRLAHMSNAELAASVSVTDQAAARRNAGEAVSMADGAQATYNAAKLILKSKSELASAVNESRCVNTLLRFDY